MNRTEIKDGRERIREAIVVEGRDDAAEVSKVFDTLIIITHGFGIREETWELIGKAYREKGIIILTDPDYSGEEIRRRITQRYPDAGQAWIPRADAVRDGDIGVENASGEAIRQAVRKAHVTAAGSPDDPVTREHLARLGLTGTPGAAERRDAVCAYLGIGGCNSRTLLRRLAAFGIGKEALTEAVHTIEK
ncbi:MAG: ribonuclease M5 [Lachnospiraceae bacterium]|nr:ribonuclease M5 [Lachnospiraceae bacterium]MBQ6582947.1 ribonuclease M5 [Mogibacterium sp.]